MAAWLDNCRFAPTAGGTTDWTFSAAVTGYQSPAAAGVVNGRLYKYFAISADLTQWEMGEGAYNTGTGVLARTTVLYNSSGTGTATGQTGAGTKISFTLAPQVAVVGIKEDLISIEEANSFTTAQKTQARANIGAPGGDDSAWTAYTPTVTAQSGAITSYSATGRYKQVGKVVIMQADVTITSAGTGAGGLRVTLPFTAAAFNFAGTSREIVNTGKAGSSNVIASGTTLDARDATGATYIATGNEIVCFVEYEVP